MIDWEVRKSYKISIIFEKNDLDCDVIDILILSLPSFDSRLLQNLHSLLSIIPDECWCDHFHDFLIGDELPKTVWGYHYEFVVWIKENLPLVT